MVTDNMGEEGKVVRIAPPREAIIAVLALGITGALYLFALFINTVTEHQYIGRDIDSQTTITVEGDGEAYAAPDIATVSFGITQEAKNATDARKLVDEKMKKIHDFLSQSGIAEKDIKTTGYNLYPKYEYLRSATICPMTQMANGVYYPCPPEGKQVLTGYEVTQSVDVKIRNLDAAGTVIGGLTDNGATNVSGLNFMVENEDGVKADARKVAIDKAKAKAYELADQLGVELVRITSFNEGGNYPIYNYRTEMKAMSADAGGAAPTPNIPTGENKYVSNVTIIYEIR